MHIRQTSKIFTIEGRVVASNINHHSSIEKDEMMWRWSNGVMECVAISISGDGRLSTQFSVVMSDVSKDSVPVEFDFIGDGSIYRIRKSGKSFSRHFISDGYWLTKGELTPQQIDELCENGDLASEDDDAYNLRYEEK